MSDQLEFYAASVEEAVDKAAAAIGVARDQLDFRIVDRGSTGFLGIGTRDARIMVEYPELQGRVPPPGQSAVEGRGEAPVGASENSGEPGQPVEGDVGVQTTAAPHDLIVAVDEFMTTLVDTMGLDATVDAYDAGEVVRVNVATEETGLFIGHKGETMDAIQHLINVVTYRERPFVKRIVVDSGGYRQRRVEALQGMAHRTARRVLRENRPLSLPAMSAAERRVVHLFLKENPAVATASEGKEENRRVIVRPT